MRVLTDESGEEELALFGDGHLDVRCMPAQSRVQGLLGPSAITLWLDSDDLAGPVHAHGGVMEVFQLIELLAVDEGAYKELVFLISSGRHICRLLSLKPFFPLDI